MEEKIKIDDFFGVSNHKLIIRDIFALYLHKWDIIGELIQNAVDSVLVTAEQPPQGYKPFIKIIYNARTREITIENNGIGMPSERVKKVVSPHVSFKKPTEATRGEFGVGLTFVAFASNDFMLESIYENEKNLLHIRNGYSWAMDEEENVNIDIIFKNENLSQDIKPYTKISFKPIRFIEYTLEQLKYILQRYTAIGDFWACYKNEKGPIEVKLTYVDENGKSYENDIPNKFWHPADFLKELINVDSVDLMTVKKEVEEKGKEVAMPNWIGFGLTDKDTLQEGNKEFAYYALFCKIPYYKQISKKIGLISISEEEEIASDIELELEAVDSGIFISKKGMPLGATVDYPKKVLAGFWRMIFMIINCDNIRTEPGRKKLHVEDERIVKIVAGKIFDKLTKYHHYFIPRDPDEAVESLLRNVQKNIDEVKIHSKNYPLVNPSNKINIFVEPINEQTLIALFHELIGSNILKGYKAHRLSATETYDGIYEYKIEKNHIGKQHWEEWLQNFPAKDRKEIENKAVYHIDFMIVEFKMHLEDIIKDFLQKTKYHHHIKLIVAWETSKDSIKRKGWLLEDLPQPKQKFYGAKWRLRPSAEGQTRGILATDVLILKDFLENINNV